MIKLILHYILITPFQICLLVWTSTVKILIQSWPANRIILLVVDDTVDSRYLEHRSISNFLPGHLSIYSLTPYNSRYLEPRYLELFAISNNLIGP